MLALDGNLNANKVNSDHNGQLDKGQVSQLGITVGMSLTDCQETRRPREPGERR
jgi:hypothetical protein